METKNWGELLKYTQLRKSLQNVVHFWDKF